MLISLLFSQPIMFFVVFGALVVCLSIHEFAHAYVADKLGDDTARYLGRLTLNPSAHLDVMGTLFLLFAGFGWGNPVPVNPSNLKNPKRDMALIAFAGPFSNFLLAIFLSLILKITFVGLPDLLVVFIFYVILYNLVLGIFNLIPVNPLDGFKIVLGLLPYQYAVQWQQLAPYGIYILLLMIFTNTTELIINPILSFSVRVLGISGF